MSLLSWVLPAACFHLDRLPSLQTEVNSTPDILTVEPLEKRNVGTKGQKLKE